MKGKLFNGHITRFSDASTFDEICVNCGATDNVPGGWGALGYSCNSNLDDICKCSEQPEHKIRNHSKLEEIK